MVTRRGHSPRERSSSLWSRGRVRGRSRAARERGHPAARLASAMGPDAATIAHVTRVERSSRRRGASAAADGCRRHATSGASARACPRRELPTEGPFFDTDRRRRARGSSARAPTRVARRAPRGSVTTTRGCRGTFHVLLLFLSGIRRRGEKEKKPVDSRRTRTRTQTPRSRRLRSCHKLFVQRRPRICARGKRIYFPPPSASNPGCGHTGIPLRATAKLSPYDLGLV